MIAEVTGNATYTAQFSRTVNKYTVTWVIDGVEEPEEYEYGATPTHADPVKEADAQYTYTFTGWTPAITTVTGDATYKARFTATKRSYIITWQNDDGSLIETTTAEYGTIPTLSSNPSKESTAEFDYTFAGWEPEVVQVTGDATYTATYRADRRSYVINFVNEDGTELQSSEVEYGQTPAYTGETPAKAADAQYTYSFAGWTPAIVAVSGTATYTATYESTVNKYTIKFVNEDGTVLQSSEVAYGETPAYTGETPSKEGNAQYSYTFSAWSPAITSVTGAATYTANYTETVNKYTIKFVNEDGTELQSSEVEYGETPAYTGETPTKAATAQYTYTFVGWTPAIAEVTGSATYTATYTETVNKYTIKFVNEDGTELQSSEVEYGETPAYTGETPTKAATAQYTYTFVGWTPAIAEVTGIATYTATYSSTVNKYTIKFVNEDGTELQSSEVAYGETPAYTGETPSKEGNAQYSYTFSAWSPAITSVTGAATYTATYTETVNKYTITFVNEDGTELQSGEVAYGEMPAYTGETPAKTATAQYTYTFTGWTPAIAEVSGAATYTATYSSTVNKYTVTWKNADGTVLETDENVEYGTNPSFDGETPTQAADAQYTYTFSGWNPAIAAVTGNVTYTLHTTQPSTSTLLPGRMQMEQFWKRMRMLSMVPLRLIMVRHLLRQKTPSTHIPLIVGTLRLER